VIPDSRRRPHVVSREITKRKGNGHKFWLRDREVWVRKTGGRELATADDIDEMYEGKLRRLVEERVRPLRERIEELERDLREQRSVVPELGFGLIASDSFDALPEGVPSAGLNNLIDTDYINNEIAWAEDGIRAAAQRQRFGLISVGVGGSHRGDYEEYRQSMEAWGSELADYLVVSRRPG